MNLEKTFVAIKPDATSRRLIGVIIQRLEATGLEMIGMKLLHVPRQTAEEHYSEHKGKSFFEDLVSFITSGPIVAMAWQGNHAIEIVRKILGATDPVKAQPGTIRGDYGNSIEQNIIHASDSSASAARELKLFFPEGLIHIKR
ncbi:MAG: nucleoside-diphosphate kinase [Candidatus Caenarcaniphilales bacterium]|nr:nucleoside-diphosphate kinase [Candidatus Caenarcaniphilales bacterium]